MERVAARSVALVLAGAVLITLLSGCKASEKVVVDSVDGSSWVKCAMGQSFVKEAADDDPTQYGAATEAWKDYLCANEDTAALWWDRLDVFARKYNGNYLCDTSPQVATTTKRSVSVSESDTCTSTGSSHIWVMGTHGASRQGAGTSMKRELSVTPEVSTF